MERKLMEGPVVATADEGSNIRLNMEFRPARPYFDSDRAWGILQSELQCECF